jgi:hypothetical protein
MSEAITYDNIYLSKVIQAPNEPLTAAVNYPIVLFNCTDLKSWNSLPRQRRQTPDALPARFEAFPGVGRSPSTSDQVARYLVDQESVTGLFSAH